MFCSLKLLLLISVLIYPQMNCHGSWATSTADENKIATSSSSLAISKAPSQTSSEATLLTIPQLMTHATKRMHNEANPYDNDDGLLHENTVKNFNKQNFISKSINKIETINEFSEPSTSISSSLPSMDTDPSEGSKRKYNGGRRKKQHFYKIVKTVTNCTRDLFEMQLELNNSFRGIVYASDFPLECRTRGNTQKKIKLRLPTSGCGIRADPQRDGSMELSVSIMVQMDQKLRQSSDILRTVRCTLPAKAMGLNVFLVNRGRFVSRNARMQTVIRNTNHNSTNIKYTSDVTTRTGPLQNGEGVNLAHLQSHASAEAQQSSLTASTNSESDSNDGLKIVSSKVASASTPRVRIWLELGGPNGSGSVEVGVATTLSVRAIVPGTMGVRVVDCAALDGLGESTQQLLDEYGCPIDDQVMPELKTNFKLAEEGWSKLSGNDLMEKSFSATFPAFKFPDRERLHVSCGVQLCKGECPTVNCQTNKLDLSTEKHLARIEVFNSLAVTAPQIEVDRLRHDNFLTENEEFGPYERATITSDTLCLSVSKVALSFCILGLIFLLAIVVAICALLRSKRRTALQQSYHGGGCADSNGNSTRAYRADVCTSMFSSSSESAQSAHFGSKLLIPYYLNTLPYGRVH